MGGLQPSRRVTKPTKLAKWSWRGDNGVAREEEFVYDNRVVVVMAQWLVRVGREDESRPGPQWCNATGR